MAPRKSELYSSLLAELRRSSRWDGCEQSKGHVLSLLFIKYISDKFDGQPFSPIKIPDGARFEAMIALKGTSDIGDLQLKGVSLRKAVLGLYSLVKACQVVTPISAECVGL